MRPRRLAVENLKRQKVVDLTHAGFNAATANVAVENEMTIYRIRLQV